MSDVSGKSHLGEHRRRVLLGMVRMATGTMLSRVAGFAIFVVVAYYYGVSRDADIFWMAFTIANLFRMVVAERAIESAFLPTFKGFLARGQTREAWRLVSSVFHLVLVGSVLLAVVLAAAAPWVVRGLAYQFSAEEQALTTLMARLLMPLLVLYAVAAFLGALLLAFGRFTWYGAAPALFGVGSVLGVIILFPVLRPHGQQIYALAVGALLGGLMQTVVQVPVIFTRSIRTQSQLEYEAVLDWKMPALRQVGWLLMPVLASAGIEKAGTIVDRTLASGLEVGSIAALTYAFRLVAFPFALIGLALGRSVLPSLSEDAATNRFARFRLGSVLALRYSFLLLIPATAVTVVVAEPLVVVLFRRGEFTPTAVRLTSLALWGYGIGLIPMAWVSNLSRSFHALRDTRTPLFAGGAGLVVNVALSVLLIRTPLRVGGLAVATSASMALTAGLMLWWLERSLEQKGAHAATWLDIRWWGYALVAAGVCFGVMAVARWAVFSWLVEDDFWHSCIRLMVPSAAGGLLYGVVVLRLGLHREPAGTASAEGAPGDSERRPCGTVRAESRPGMPTGSRL